MALKARHIKPAKLRKGGKPGMIGARMMAAKKEGVKPKSVPLERVKKFQKRAKAAAQQPPTRSKPRPPTRSKPRMALGRMRTTRAKKR